MNHQNPNPESMNEKLSEILKMKGEEFDEKYPFNSQGSPKEGIKLFIRSSLIQCWNDAISKQTELLEDYWFYAGKWHKAECKFLMWDDGVCNCKNYRSKIKGLKYEK